MTRALAVLGSASGVGKSLVTAGLCRLLRDAGCDVAPYKAQNMANQAGVTPDGLEMPRAQILQAVACRLPPHVDMGPVLMKPVSSTVAEIVVLGRAIGQREARDYFRDTSQLAAIALAALDRLAARHRVLVLEGAGSPVELNLMARDFVNLRPARHLGAALVLVVDVHQGGVFAQARGTLDLLPPEDRARVVGLVVNRFRGDLALFDDGIALLEQSCGVPVLAVVPYYEALSHGHALDEEDGPLRLPIDERAPDQSVLRVGIVLHPHVANTEELWPLTAEPDLHLSWLTDPRLVAEQDLLVLPGSKATLADLAHHAASGMSRAVVDAAKRGAWVLGLCGGYQMLGRDLRDEAGTEGGPPTWPGLGLLPVDTVFRADKRTVEAAFRSAWPERDLDLRGYEIHHGQSALTDERPHDSDDGPLFLGHGAEAAWRSGRALGTYLHGLLGNDAWRAAFLNRARRSCRLPERPLHPADSLDLRLDRWAAHLRRSLRPGAWERLLACVRNP